MIIDDWEWSMLVKSNGDGVELKTMLENDEHW